MDTKVRVRKWHKHVRPNGGYKHAKCKQDLTSTVFNKKPALQAAAVDSRINTSRHRLAGILLSWELISCEPHHNRMGDMQMI